MFETLKVSTHGAIAELWLDRTDKLNALSQQLLQELIEVAHWLDQQKDIRVVIIGGYGKAFCVGADFSAFPASGDKGATEVADLGRVMADTIEGMSALTIARIHGWCVGGGLVLAAACDLRVADDSAMFSIPEVDLGIPLAWGGIPRLVREIGPALTKELVISCRPFAAKEAQSAGFLNRVVEADKLDHTVHGLAAQCAAKPRFPVIATKRHVNAVTAQMTGMAHTWSDAGSLLAASTDPECVAAQKAYIDGQKKK